MTILDTLGKKKKKSALNVTKQKREREENGLDTVISAASALVSLDAPGAPHSLSPPGPPVAHLSSACCPFLRPRGGR